MPISAKTREFLASELADGIRDELKRMTDDKGYNTRSTYSAAAKGDVLFADRHIAYLSLNLNVEPVQYISNLKLMTKYN